MRRSWAQAVQSYLLACVQVWQLVHKRVYAKLRLCLNGVVYLSLYSVFSQLYAQLILSLSSVGAELSLFYTGLTSPITKYLKGVV